VRMATNSQNLQMIAIHEPLKQYVDEQSVVDGLESPGEYVESLIHADQERRVAEFEATMLKALNSGRVEITENELMRADFLEILEERHATLAQSSE
jgi:hypothetical protein